MSHSYPPCPVCGEEMDIELNHMGEKINHHKCKGVQMKAAAMIDYLRDREKEDTMKAAIDFLKRQIHELESAKILSCREGELQDFRQALAILEAAEKVDKKRCLFQLDPHVQFNASEPTMTVIDEEGRAMLRALLESLPDKKE